MENQAMIIRSESMLKRRYLLAFVCPVVALKAKKQAKASAKANFRASC